MHIVVVEPGPGLVASLEQSIAEFGLDWSVGAAARSAPDAADGRVDVLVSGVGHGPDHEAGARSVLEGAHRVLQKPLDPVALIDAVEGIAELRELLDDARLKQHVGRVDRLPAAPRMYFQLSRLMRDPEVGLGEIADTLAQDPALVARVLKLCNSAYFSAGREITDPRSAVTRLGMCTVQHLVLATEAFGHAPGLSSGEREAMQGRALRVSRLAGRLLAGPSAELAATAGMLAEVGRLLPMSGPEATSPGYPEAGAYLLGLWGLPMPIVEAVAFHRQPRARRAAGFWVTGALHVATALVRGERVDEAYLQSVGMHDRLPQWRALLEQDLARAA